MKIDEGNSPFHGVEKRWFDQLRRERLDDVDAYLDFALERVSRTFALNIKVLSGKLRRDVHLAYLFCRMADTLEDDPDLVPGEKMDLLHRFQELFPVTAGWEERCRAFVDELPSSWAESDKWDKLLTYYCIPVFRKAFERDEATRSILARWIREMSGGMIEFTGRLKYAARGEFIRDLADLERYCYFVAGTVGIMLCDLFSHHSASIGGDREIRMRELSVSFGLGLQLTNIVKDVHEDGQRDVSFIPGQWMRDVGIRATDLESRDHLHKKRVILRRLLQKARDHLEDALKYTCIIPRRELRIRLFCLWPLFMAMESLVAVAGNLGASDSRDKVKITRGQVKSILQDTTIACWSNKLLWRRFYIIDRKLEAALGRI